MGKNRAYIYLFIMGFISIILSKSLFLIAGLFMITFGRENNWMMLFGMTFIITVFLYAVIEEIRIIHQLRKSDHPVVKIIRENIEASDDLLSGMQTAEMQLFGRGRTVYEPFTDADKDLTDLLEEIISDRIVSCEGQDISMFVLKINVMAVKAEDLCIEMDQFTKEQYGILVSDDRRAIKRAGLDRKGITLADRKSSVYDRLIKWGSSEENEDEVPAVGIRFAGVVVRAIKNIHERGLLAERYGRELPIMITDVLINSYLKKLNVEANGEDLVESVTKGLFKE